MPDTGAAATARGVIRATPKAALATLHRRQDGPDDIAGWPYASLVLVAVDLDATPILLLSDLADHTRNLKADGRVALLFDGTAGFRDPLAGPRVTVLGRIAATDTPRHRRRYLSRHPAAELYAGFGDFRLYAVQVERAHLVAGFGRITWIAGPDLRDAAALACPLAEQDAEIVADLNAHAGDLLDRAAHMVLGRSGQGWRATGVDPEGCDLRLGSETGRLAFPERIVEAGGVREALAALTERPRGGLEEP